MRHTILDRRVPNSRRRGFTIMELLVVMAIVGILAVAIIGGGNSVTGGVNLTGAAGIVVDDLNTARQAAMSRNIPVEVRFFQAPNEEHFDTVAVVLMGSTPEYLSPGTRLPNAIIIDSNTEVTTIAEMGLSTEERPDANERRSVPRALWGRQYIFVRYNTDGTLDVTVQGRDGAEAAASPLADPDFKWCMTIRPIAGPRGEDPLATANFITLVFDPLTGRTSLFQP